MLKIIVRLTHLSSNFQQVGRSLFCLGLLVRYGNELMVACNSQNVLVVKCVSLLKNYLLAEDFGIKVRSLQVGYIFSFVLEMCFNPLTKIFLCSNLHLCRH